MALSYFTIRKSIFGRLLGISSTGGLVMGVSSTGGVGAGSSDVAMAAQMWGPEMVQTIGAGATLTKIVNSGVTIFTTASSAAAIYSIDAPVPGVEKKLLFRGLGSTLITLNTTAATIVFHHPATGASVASTTLIYTSSTLAPAAVYMVGESTLIWGIVNKTMGAISS